MPRRLRKAISPIIATVLLILIAIATGIVIYAFASGWIGSRLNQSAGPQANLVVESGYYNATGKYFIVYVRNGGGVPVNISRVYIQAPDGTVTLLTPGHGLSAATGYSLEVTPNNVTALELTYTAKIGYTYKITVVGSDGSEASYTIRA